MTQRRTQRGFTLIEMLVVIFILAVLVAIIVGVSGYVMRQAAVKQTKQTMEMVMTAIDEYRQANGNAVPVPTGGSYANLATENQALLTALTGVPRAKQRLEKASSDALTGGYILDGFGQKLWYVPTGGPNGGPVLISSGADGHFALDNAEPGMSGATTQTKSDWQSDNVRSDEPQ